MPYSLALCLSAVFSGTLSARRRAGAFVRGNELVSKLFSSFAERYKFRPGGFTRVMHLKFRKGDNAPLSVLELVDR